jgi:cytochrome c-type biogenesis protein CcmH
MTLFWLVGAALAAAVVGLVLRPFLRKNSAAALSRRDVNVSIYRDQLRELDADLKGGLLAQADYERARRELEARALEDVAQEAAPAARGGRGLAWARRGRAWLAGVLYLLVGSPGALPTVRSHAMRCGWR